MPAAAKPHRRQPNKPAPAEGVTLNFPGDFGCDLAIEADLQHLVHLRCIQMGVEFVDLYVTLAELAALPPPVRHDGASFAALLTNPAGPGKDVVFSEIMRRGRLGRAIRSATHRYVEWSDKSGAVVGRELYDQIGDPEENQNVVDAPEHRTIVERLSSRLKASAER